MQTAPVYGSPVLLRNSLAHPLGSRRPHAPRALRQHARGTIAHEARQNFRDDVLRNAEETEESCANTSAHYALKLVQNRHLLSKNGNARRHRNEHEQIISAQNGCGPKSPLMKDRGLIYLERAKTPDRSITQVAKMSVDS